MIFRYYKKSLDKALETQVIINSLQELENILHTSNFSIKFQSYSEKEKHNIYVVKMEKWKKWRAVGFLYDNPVFNKITNL